MKTVQSTESIKLKIKPDELINKEWLSFQLLSKKLADIEKSKNMQYKNLRNKMYNSQSCNKYNTAIIAGLKCISVKDPMRGTASLELSFEVA